MLSINHLSLNNLTTHIFTMHHILIQLQKKENKARNKKKKSIRKSNLMNNSNKPANRGNLHWRWEPYWRRRRQGRLWSGCSRPAPARRLPRPVGAPQAWTKLPPIPGPSPPRQKQRWWLMIQKAAKTEQMRRGWDKACFVFSLGTVLNVLPSPTPLGVLSIKIRCRWNFD